MGKKLLKILLAVFLLLIVVLVATPLWIDGVARQAIEIAGTDALGVATRLKSIRIGLVRGTAGIKGLNIANPEGYESPHFMDLGRGSVTVRVGSLMADTVEIENLTIEELDVHLEKNGDGYNYEKILEHVERGLARGGDEDGEPGGKKFIIREVLIRKIRVRYDVNLLGVTEAPVKFTISQRRYEDLGSGRGLGMGEVITLVISEVMSSVAKAGTELPGDLVKGLSKGVVAVGKGILDGVGGVFKKKK